MRTIRLLFLATILIVGLQACTYPDWYLQHHSGLATQDQIVDEMGQPAKKEALPDGGSRWTYYHHVSYATYLTYSNPDAEVCYTYVLTFDAQGLLQNWNRYSRNCGAVN